MRRTNFVYTDPDPSRRLALAVPAIARAAVYGQLACELAAMSNRSPIEESQEDHS